MVEVGAVGGEVRGEEVRAGKGEKIVRNFHIKVYDFWILCPQIFFRIQSQLQTQFGLCLKLGPI